MTKELRAAAERIKRIRAGVEKSQDIYGVPVRNNPTRMESIEAGNKVKRLMLDDERALVDYAIDSLATVSDDDDEPVTVEWLRSQCGFYGDGEVAHRWITSGWRLYFINRVSRPAVMWTGGDRHLTTRGQVRDLLRALGKDVK